jgi:PAS domain S-box-containing protein
MNKLLQRQLLEHFGADKVPENFSKLMNDISGCYDHFEKDIKMMGNSFEPGSKEMIELKSRQTEAQLERSFSLLEATLESTADGLLVADLNGKIVRFNNKFIELWHIPREILDERDDEKAIAFVSDQLINPHEFLSKTKELYVRQRDVSFDILKFKDGRTFERYSQPQLINGNCVGRVWSFRDITERKNTEEALKESERRLRQIIDLVPHFIFAKNAKGIFTLANEAVAGVYGSTVENLLGKSDVDFNSNKKEIEHFIQEDLEVINSGNARYNIEETITDAAGNIRVLSTTKIPYTSPGVDTPGILGVSVDISERKNAEAALIKRDSQLTLAAQMAGLGYWEYDVINDLFTFNDQFYAIFKTTAENVGGYTMSSARYTELFVYADDKEIVGKGVAEAINSDNASFSLKAEHRIIDATGETGYISVHFYIVKDKEGRTIKSFGVNQDITERKKVEESLRRSEINLEIKNTQLEQKNIELEQFAFIASHDLQEPLRTTSSFVKLLQKQYKGKLDPKADKYFTYILEASDRMKVLIKNLLDLSRIGHKKEQEQVDCNEMLQNVLADLGKAISEAKADIKSEPLPVIYGYATELKQLFQNLITNAIKFRRKETMPVLNISLQKNDGYWQFEFKDNGIGIEEKHHEKIFAIFQRLHTQTEYEGSGIGLSHCKKIVELHKGKIWVESWPGEGSTFYFTLPAGQGGLPVRQAGILQQ